MGEIPVIKNGKSRPNDKGNIPVYNSKIYYTNKHNTIDETIIIGRVVAYCRSVFLKINHCGFLIKQCLQIQKKQSVQNVSVIYLKKKYKQIWPRVKSPTFNPGILND